MPYKTYIHLITFIIYKQEQLHTTLAIFSFYLKLFKVIYDVFMKGYHIRKYSQDLK